MLRQKILRRKNTALKAALFKSVPVANSMRHCVWSMIRKLVGEGNFTFSLAIAALRGSWHGITDCMSNKFLKVMFCFLKVMFCCFQIRYQKNLPT